MAKAIVPLAKHFENLSDPRIEKKSDHKLIDIVILAICGTICGAEGWSSIEEFGKTKKKWFKKFLELPNGIPSHDTFGRVFSLISPLEFQKCFVSWVGEISHIVDKEVVGIDGKTSRRSHDRQKGKSPIHMVSAWASKAGLVLGQVKTSEKSNEITAIPELLKVLEVKGAIVTIDAMGCQKEIAQKIIDKKADYILALKGNQGKLHESVEEIFNEADKTYYKNISVDYYENKVKNHGRTEIRRCWTTDSLDKVSQREMWKGLNTIGMIESERHMNGEVSIEHRYYIGSIENNAKLFLNSVRDHWGVENSLHWVLDVAFQEDHSRVRAGNAPGNLSVLRHIAINLLRKEKTVKLGTKSKRLKAGWDNKYLEKILAGFNV